MVKYYSCIIIKRWDDEICISYASKVFEKNQLVLKKKMRIYVFNFSRFYYKTKDKTYIYSISLIV